MSRNKKKSNAVIKKSGESIEPESSGSGRREFLTKSAVLVAFLGTSGLTGISDLAEGQKKPRTEAAMTTCGGALTRVQAKQLQMVMDHAMQNGNIQESLKLHGRGLSPQIHGILGQLNSEDLRAAASLQEKLSALRPCAADNNGTIGM